MYYLQFMSVYFEQTLTLDFSISELYVCSNISHLMEPLHESLTQNYVSSSCERPDFHGFISLYSKGSSIYQHTHIRKYVFTIYRYSIRNAPKLASHIRRVSKAGRFREPKVCQTSHYHQQPLLPPPCPTSRWPGKSASRNSQNTMPEATLG